MATHIEKAAGQKVGSAEVNISIIRMIARSTEAFVRDKYGYIPPNQFNVDLCLDFVQVMNRLPKSGQEKSPCEIITRKKIDYLRDFSAEWGEILLVKKAKATCIKFDCHWRIGRSSEKEHELHWSSGGLIWFGQRNMHIACLLKMQRHLNGC
jgi:hypothetical protein